jgi:uncharacterized protein YjcR
MNSLEVAILACGGVTRLAEKLDVKPNRIHNWRTRGVPDGWLSVLRIKFKREIAAAKKFG